MTFRHVLTPYFELTKPRITALVVITTALGFFMSGGGISDPTLLWTLLGTALVSGGAGALNHVWERDADARMLRTRNRPVASGRINAARAAVFGLLLIAAGASLLYACVNGLAAMLALTSAVLYVGVYTPLKRISWWNTPVGAVPGAIPPLIGWAGATGSLRPEAWILFFILFLWQHPHFYAIAQMFADDYRRGGFKMLSVVDASGYRILRQSLSAALLLVPLSVFPTFTHMAGWGYGLGALLASSWYLWVCVKWWLTPTVHEARHVLRVSVFYLPLILGALMADTLWQRMH